jgi:hypothetical protein
MAHGMKDEAKASKIKIYRVNDKGGKDVIEADYDAISKGAIPDVLVSANDIIIVPENGVKAFFNSFVKYSVGLLPVAALGAL